MAFLNTQDNDKQNLDEFNLLRKEKDENIDALFARLVSDTKELENANFTIVKKNDIITNIEFIIARLRFLIIDELKRVEFGLSNFENSKEEEKYKVWFTKRKTYLNNLNGKLNEIREDLSLIQKSIYYNYKY